MAQATGYGLLVSVLQRNRADFDGFLRFWRQFLTEHGLMFWQLLRHNGVVRLPTPGSPPRARTDARTHSCFHGCQTRPPPSRLRLRPHTCSAQLCSH